MPCTQKAEVLPWQLQNWAARPHPTLTMWQERSAQRSTENDLGPRIPRPTVSLLECAAEI